MAVRINKLDSPDKSHHAVERNATQKKRASANYQSKSNIQRSSDMMFYGFIILLFSPLIVLRAALSLLLTGKLLKSNEGQFANPDVSEHHQMQAKFSGEFPGAELAALFCNFKHSHKIHGHLFIETLLKTKHESLHVIAHINYLGRFFGNCLAGLILAVILSQGDHFYSWGFWVVFVLFWPHIAYLICRFSADSKKAEFNNMLTDAVIFGIWLSVISFQLMPASVFVFCCLCRMFPQQWPPLCS